MAAKKLYNTEEERLEARRLSYNKYRLNNRAERNKDSKKNRKNSKHDYRIVYLLKNGYVGSTNSLKARLSHHKHVGRCIDNVVILFASYNPEEANGVECYYHSIGYKGARGHNASV